MGKSKYNIFYPTDYSEKADVPKNMKKMAESIDDVIDDNIMESLKSANDSIIEMQDALNEKVNREEGKGLSEEDFTTTLKNKLDGIEVDANKTIVDEELSLESVNPVQNKVVTEEINAVIEQMEDDKEDLQEQINSIEGKDNVIEIVKQNGVPLPVGPDKSVNVITDNSLWEILFTNTNYFSEDTTYHVGDFTIYNNKLYKTVTEHTGAWNTEDFEQSSVFVE